MLCGEMIRRFRAAPALLVAFILTLNAVSAVENTWDYSVQVSASQSRTVTPRPFHGTRLRTR